MAESPDVGYTPPPRSVLPIVLACVAVVLLAVSIGAYFYLRDSLAPRVRRQSEITASLDHLRQLAVLLAERSLRRGFPPYTGKRFVLSLVADGVIDVRRPSNLEVLFSPADPDRGVDRVAPERWPEVTRAALAVGADVDDLTSYVGPAGAVTAAEAGPVPILADLHLEDVALVAFSDGSARALDREELGLGPEDPIVAGEGSKNPILRRLSAE